MNFKKHCMGYVAAALFAFADVSLAAPGAHGPNGEHLDGPATQVQGSSAPRLETRSESFEMVGRLSVSEFSMFINRYETNEPVLNAQVELELGNLKATAPFHADQGDYAVADEAFLKALAAPGEHAMVIMVTAGNEADLLDGTLVVLSESAEHGHGHHMSNAIKAAIVAGLALLFLIGWAVMRRKATAKKAGASQ